MDIFTYLGTGIILCFLLLSRTKNLKGYRTLELAKISQNIWSVRLVLSSTTLRSNKHYMSVLFLNYLLLFLVKSKILTFNTLYIWLLSFCCSSINLTWSYYAVAQNDALFKELWHACAGPLVTVPREGERVYYFLQGHMEQVWRLLFLLFFLFFLSLSVIFLPKSKIL